MILSHDVLLYHQVCNLLVHFIISPILYFVILINYTFVISLATEKPQLEYLCNNLPCGLNAICKNGECECLPEYCGNPYEGCRPECILNSECPRDKTCIRNKCIDPCPGTCGQNAECDVVNHIPVCSCIVGYIGDPFVNCRLQPQSML